MKAAVGGSTSRKLHAEWHRHAVEQATRLGEQQILVYSAALTQRWARLEGAAANSSFVERITYIYRVRCVQTHHLNISAYIGHGDVPMVVAGIDTILSWVSSTVKRTKRRSGRKSNVFAGPEAIFLLLMASISVCKFYAFSLSETVQ